MTSVQAKKYSNKIVDAICYALLGLLVLTIILTFRDYGISWDEVFQAEYGRRSFEYFYTFGADRTSLDYLNSYYYGPLVEIICETTFRIFPSLGLYESRHLTSALIGAIGVLGCFKIGRLCGGSYIGLLSLLGISLFPTYYGHIFINAKDIPFAVGSIWSLYYSILIIRNLPTIQYSQFFKLGIVIGLSTSIRVGGVIFVGYLFTGLLIWSFLNYRLLLEFINEKSFFRFTLKLIIGIVTTIITFYTLMIVFWPASHKDPFGFPFVALKYFSNFEGQTQDTLQYLLTYLPVKIPEIFILLTLLGTLILFLDFLRSQDCKIDLATHATLFTALIFPLMLVVIKKSYLYNELRHVLFVLPTLLLFCTVSAGRLVEMYPKYSVISLVSALFLLHIATVGLSLIKLHPYQYIYYNDLSGGVRGAFHKQLPLDYWCTSYKEISKFFIKTLQSKGKKTRYRTFKLYAHGPFWGATLYLKNKIPKVSTVGTQQEADYFISYTDNRSHLIDSGKSIYQVERFGVPIAVLKKL